MWKNNTDNNEDGTIVVAILSGDVERFNLLLNKYGGLVFSIVRRRVPVGMVDSVAQDVFIRAFKALDGYTDDNRFGSWLARIAVRTCCDYWREHKRHDARRLDPGDTDCHCALLEHAGGCASVEQAVALARRQDAEAAVNMVLRQLSAEDRTLVESIYFDDMKLKDVAAALGWSLVKTKVRAMRARRTMRKILESIGDF
ncbi:MAG: sigma-70 family RNA polymerase sigma factor [Victivallales bacterium]|nr:sigma-70 family RNA polymerase sigma factor [Victivallales bacterium]